MLFNSLSFALFFAVVYAAYFFLMRRHRVQNAMLLAASYVFYGSWDWRFLGLIAASTLTDYLCGLAIDRRSSGGARETAEGIAPFYYAPRTRKSLLAVSIAFNLGLLGLYKYYDFFAAECAEFLSAIGLPLAPRLLNVVLPVGISFYTFQTLSYTIDVYRGHVRARRNLLDFALFVSFFPQLVAGPILRAREFLPQIEHPRRLSLSQTYEGGFLILWGLFKKVVIADNLAGLVDEVFSSDQPMLGGTILVAAYAFAVQIYCDFSGYTDMARGFGKLLGFELRENFHLPYLAGSPSEFWRRWHMSLSEWLRDYLYIPLGGSRRGRRRTCLNLVLTMALGGLWHGAAWTFVLWGLYHGALLILYRLFGVDANGHRESTRRPSSAIRRAAAVFLFFHLTCLGWLIFRAESVGQIGGFLAAILSPWPYWILAGANTLTNTGVLTLLLYAWPLLLMHAVQHARRDVSALLNMPAWVRGLSYAAMFYGVVLLSGHDGPPFIYFQF